MRAPFLGAPTLFPRVWGNKLYLLRGGIVQQDEHGAPSIPQYFGPLEGADLDPFGQYRLHHYQYYHLRRGVGPWT